MKILGLMSGTSMDGLDCCVADLEINKNNLYFNIIHSDTYFYDDEMKQIIFDSVFKKSHSHDYLNDYLGNVFSVLISKILKKNKIDLISNHGQTISHIDKKYSIQISGSSIITQKFKIPVISDFRQDDIINGGNGAPLMPLLDWYLFNKSNVITINIGGISNISIIKKNKDRKNIIGFDTGPGMCLIDLYVKKYWNKGYDNNGLIASRGNIDKIMLDYLMKDHFVLKKSPKSASTEMYDSYYLSLLEKKFSNINRYNFLRTLVNFTANSIVKNINKVSTSFKLSDMDIIISGGGIKNKILFNDINGEFKNNNVSLMNYKGLNIDNKESFLMCLLGYTKYFNIPNNIPSVTGAKCEVSCGEIYE